MKVKLSPATARRSRNVEGFSYPALDGIQGQWERTGRTIFPEFKTEFNTSSTRTSTGHPIHELRLPDQQPRSPRRRT